MKLIVASPDEDEKAQTQPAPTDRNLPKLAVVLAVIEIMQRSIEIEVDNIGEV
ncbi:MAG TPA: hypothetical protein VKS60_15000 [Stellaceae bacterium]|nr:hypothetical protein [Stellaceae bacterium]